MEPKEEQYKFKKKVTITLESDSKPDIERIDNKYYNPKISQYDNKVGDIDKWVAISACKEDIKVNGVDKNG